MITGRQDKQKYLQRYLAIGLIRRYSERVQPDKLILTQKVPGTCQGMIPDRRGTHTEVLKFNPESTGDVQLNKRGSTDSWQSESTAVTMAGYSLERQV